MILWYFEYANFNSTGMRPFLLLMFSSLVAILLIIFYHASFSISVSCRFNFQELK